MIGIHGTARRPRRSWAGATWSSTAPAGKLFVEAPRACGWTREASGRGTRLDEVVGILSSRGVKDAIIDLGGDIFAMGSSKRRRPPGMIGIQNPDESRGVTLGVVSAVNKSVGTSGSL